MSFSSELVTAPKMPEKSSFSQRCSLLSQYLKVKGSFGDLSLGMTCNTEANVPEIYPPTMNLFPTNENQFDVSMANRQNNFRSMDLFPQQAPDLQKRIELSNIKPSTSSNSPPAQMTIFYNGQVIVFDDYPAEKAKEVMILAGKGSSQNPPPAVFSPPNLAMPQMECSTSIPCTSSGFGNNLFQDRIQPHPKPITSAPAMPIARRASLHRFLEKRKDRIISRAPYTLNGSSLTGSSSKPGESKSWLGLGAQSPVAH